MAREAGLDLVEVAPNVHPPVCRVMDYKQFKFEQKGKPAENEKRYQATKRIDGNGDGNRFTGLN